MCDRKYESETEQVPQVTAEIPISLFSVPEEEVKE